MRKIRVDSTTFGLWLIIGLAAAFLLGGLLARVCSAFVLDTGRYCSVPHMWTWLKHDGGWWKSLAALGILGCVSFFIDSGDKQRPDDPDSGRDSRE